VAKLEINNSQSASLRGGLERESVSFDRCANEGAQGTRLGSAAAEVK